ncbi:hypothetical protein [Myroides odoratus]|uniref:hypothetical protein n=1 Tax=Myroides odoratus TaxID=256 RepID=UPI0039B1047A
MIKHILTILFLTWSTALLFAQEEARSTSQKWNEMEQVTPNLRETNQIHIFDDPKPVYQLELRDNHPFNGYEISEEKLLGEFNFVNFYKNGELVAKYAIDYLNTDGTFLPVEYTLKTTYQNGKIHEGYEYHELPQGRVIVDQYKNETRNAFYIDLFAMHYFNRLSFQLKDNSIIIHNMETNNELHIYKIENVLQADFYEDKKRIVTSKKNRQQIDKIAPNASTIYYLGKDKTLKEFTFIASEQVDLEKIEDEFLRPIFWQFSFEFSGDMNQALEIARMTIEGFGKFKKADLAYLFQSTSIPYNEENFLALVHYDAQGKPEEGKVIQRLKTGEYEVMTYENGELKAKNEILDLILLQPNK